MSTPALPAGGGAMGARVRAHDWAATPLGPPSGWPGPLRTALGIVLGSGFPALLAWGPDLVCFYNDAALRLLGTAPDALGRPFEEAWPETWAAVAPVAGRALAGEAGYVEDLPLALGHGGHAEETWWTFSYSPVLDEKGGVGGVLTTMHETTGRVSAERRLRLLVELGDRLRGLACPRDAVAAAAETLGRAFGAEWAGCAEPDATGTALAIERVIWTNGGAATAAALPGRRVRLGAPVLAELRAGRAVRVDDGGNAAGGAGAAAAAPAGAGSGLLLPLPGNGGAAAVLVVHRAGDRPWRDDELALAQEAAESAWATAGRLRAEAELRASEERFRRFADFVPAFVWFADAEMTITYINNRWYAHTGQTPAQAMAGGWFDAIHPDDAERTRAVWDGSRRSGEPYLMEHRVLRADGTHRWYVSRGEPQRDGAGRVVGWFGLATDIHDRKEAEEALRVSEERFRQFAEHSTDVLWLLDAATMSLEYVSPAFARVWGRPLDAFDGPSRDIWLQTVHAEDRARAADAMERARRGETAVEEYRIVRPDGAVRRLRDTFFSIRDTAGRVTRVAGIAKDVTRHEGSLVYVVDGEPTEHERLRRVLGGAGYQVRAFGTVAGFLEAAPALVPGCVVLDASEPGHAGLAVPRELKARRVAALPVIVTARRGDVGLAVRAMKAGAVDFLESPYPECGLLAAVASAMADIQDAKGRDRAAELAAARVAAMPAREREVLDLLLAGGTNKTIARDLGISPRTVEVYRARVMERLGARTLPQAVLAAAAAGLEPPTAPPPDAGPPGRGD